jgi:hypothetical protein
VRLDIALTRTPDGLLIPLSILSHALQSSLKASLSVVAAHSQPLDDPEGLTHKTTAQIGLYTHRGLADLTLSTRRGTLTSATPLPP